MFRHSLRGQPKTSKRFHSGERGAALVEFALVAPLFFAVLMAIIDFGFIFDASGQAAQATREAGRSAAVGRFGTNDSCVLTGVNADVSLNVRKLMCLTKDAAEIQEDIRVKVLFTDGTLGGPLANGYEVGNSVVICAIAPVNSMSGLYDSMLAGRHLTARSAYRIEQPPTATETAGAETDPSGEAWAWCQP